MGSPLNPRSTRRRALVHRVQAQSCSSSCRGRCFRRASTVFLSPGCGATQLCVLSGARVTATRRAGLFTLPATQASDVPCRRASRPYTLPAARRVSDRENRIFFVVDGAGPNLTGAMIGAAGKGDAHGRLRPSGATARGESRPARPRQPERPGAASSGVASGRRRREGQSSTVRLGKIKNTVIAPPGRRRWATRRAVAL